MHCLGHLFAYPGEVSVGLGKLYYAAIRKNPVLVNGRLLGWSPCYSCVNWYLKGGKSSFPRTFLERSPDSWNWHTAQRGRQCGGRNNTLPLLVAAGTVGAGSQISAHLSWEGQGGLNQGASLAALAPTFIISLLTPNFWQSVEWKCPVPCPLMCSAASLPSWGEVRIERWTMALGQQAVYKVQET